MTGSDIGMEWWQVLIIVLAAGFFLDNIVVNICRTAVKVKEEQKRN